MAYISPSTTVKILRGCPLDSGYKNTIHFDDADEQEEYFASIVKPNGGGYTYALTDRTFQRKDAGTLKVQIPVEYLYDCNYLMFDNDRYINKWFYAFIDRVEYSNENCSIIYYTIDVMQTWMFDYELGACMVEREHTITDNIGDNLLPEDLDVGEMICTHYSKITDLSTNLAIVVATTLLPQSAYVPVEYPYPPGDTPTVDSSESFGALLGNELSGVAYYAYPLNDESTFAKLTYLFTAAKYKGKTDEIFSVFTMPFVMLDTVTKQPIGRGIYPVYQIKSANYTGSDVDIPTGCVDYAFSYTESFNGLQGYSPKNNKLFTYPYYYLDVHDNEGNHATYKFERFQNKTRPSFIFQSAVSQDYSILAVPLQYKSQLYNYEESCSISGFPLGSWRYDTFQNWLGQHGTELAVRGISSALLATYVTGNPLAGLTSGIGSTFSSASMGAMGGSTVVPSMTSIVPASRGGSVIPSPFPISIDQWLPKGGNEPAGGHIYMKRRGAYGALSALQSLSYAIHQPDQLRGNIGGGLTTFGNGLKTFIFETKSITADQAKPFDDYFSMYGYRIAQVKVPNVEKYKSSWSSLRPYWNYIKTVNCVVKPIVSTTSINSVPAEDAGLIEEIYNNGITFWTDPDEVDEYLDSNGNMRDNSPT